MLPSQLAGSEPAASQPASSQQSVSQSPARQPVGQPRGPVPQIQSRKNRRGLASKPPEGGRKGRSSGGRGDSKLNLIAPRPKSKNVKVRRRLEGAGNLCSFLLPLLLLLRLFLLHVLPVLLFFLARAAVMNFPGRCHELPGQMS